MIVAQSKYVMIEAKKYEGTGEPVMGSTGRRYSKDEFARRGDAVYSSAVEPHLTQRDRGKFVAVDIDSGEYEIRGDELGACRRLQARLPDAQIWLVRVGHRYVHSFGGRDHRREP